MKKTPSDYQAHNYFVCFVDLLGQRHVLAGQGITPFPNNEVEVARFKEVVKKSVGAILGLQENADVFLSSIDPKNSTSKVRESLPPEVHADWDAMKAIKIKTQHWSDGLMHYVNLGDKSVKCPMNGVYALLGAAANHCLIGLSTGNPIRCAIDVGWAVELSEKELYGAAVARAYELESVVAQYPRVVIGELAVDYLKAQVSRPVNNPFDEFEVNIAQICLGLIAKDIDGCWILHYLGDGFKEIFNQDVLKELHNDCLRYIKAQSALHHKNQDTKLSDRYALLQAYFENHPI